MTVYNYNLGIGWASSGVEYAQIYRARCFREAGIDARFIFTDMIRYENIEHLTANIGFKDEEVMWLYSFFTDYRIAPSTYPISAIEDTFTSSDYHLRRDRKKHSYYFDKEKKIINVFEGIAPSTVQRVETVVGGALIRADYYTYGKVFSEFFAPKDKKAELYMRQFYNTDGTVAYEELVNGDKSCFRFQDQLFDCKEEFIGYMVRTIGAGKDDVILIDRSSLIGPEILRNRGEARVGVVVHAEHYNLNLTDDDNILWNNYYEYMFTNNDEVDFYITSTEAQSSCLREQFEKYYGIHPAVYTVPVGCLEELRYNHNGRRKHAALTASRLAPEKHIDWLIKAVLMARKEIPDLSLDIYGRGKCEKECRKIIQEADAGSYIRLLGHRDLDEVYKEYELYLSASGSEGFGLTLLEAVGSGLPIIGFDVPYGNVTFVRPGKNGYLVDFDMETEERIKGLSESIVMLFKNSNTESFRRQSYEIAEGYMLSKISNCWKEIINNDLTI